MKSVRVWAREVPWREPETVFAAWGEAPWCAFLDSGGPVVDRSRWQIFCTAPRHVLSVKNGLIIQDAEPAAPFTPSDLFARLRRIMPAAMRVDNETGTYALPFHGGWIGFAGYGLGQALEQIRVDHPVSDEPDFAAGFYDHAFLWDRLEKRAFITGLFTSETEGAPASEPWQAHVTAWHALPAVSASRAPLPAVTFVPDQPRESYCAAVARARDYIAAGDIFQVNITGRYSSQFPENFSNVALYLALRQHAPAPFGAYLGCGGGYALHSTSPEQFLQVNAQRGVTSRPIKGTAPRGRTPEEDSAFAAALALDEKERAENLMIVDLMRHDIGRVARVGSMSVPEFLAVERFAHVHHLVSEVRGELASGRDVFDLLQATLPPGSVTGAPKHRAMEVIEELEASPRGAYCGSVFCIGVEGRMESSVIIRTVTRVADRLTLASGGGITILSDPEKEYEEMRLKLAPFFSLFGGAA